MQKDYLKAAMEEEEAQKNNLIDEEEVKEQPPKNHYDATDYSETLGNGQDQNKHHQYTEDHHEGNGSTTNTVSAALPCYLLFSS